MLLTLFAYPIKLLVSYGYFALFIWSILEGKIGLMLSGFLASKGEVFHFLDIVIVASVGAFIGDNTLFLLGRYFAPKAKIWLIKYKEKRILIQRYFRKYGSFVIVFERFIYGTHIPALLIVGLSRYPYGKFLLFDSIGILLWAAVFTSIGYYFGDTAIDIIIFIQKTFWLYSSSRLFSIFFSNRKKREALFNKTLLNAT